MNSNKYDNSTKLNGTNGETNLLSNDHGTIGTKPHMEGKLTNQDDTHTQLVLKVLTHCVNNADNLFKKLLS